MTAFDDDYTTGKLLGEGAFAQVKVAESKNDGSQYAVKIVDKSKLAAEDEECIRLEISSLSKLKHPNIIQLFGVYDESKNFYLVMELVKGGELFDRIVSKSVYTEKEARDACKSLFEAIDFCHTHCVAHRDLKPENLLLMNLDSDTEVKIADFGFSKAVVAPDIDCLTTRCGTPEYVAPDVLSGKAYSAKVDVWSLGVIIYILLCGYPPFYDENVRKLFRQILKARYDFHPETWGGISDEAKDLVSKLLVPRSSDRLSTEEALQHPWFTQADEKLTSNDLGKTQAELKEFNRNRRFKAAARAVIVSNRLKSLISNQTPSGKDIISAPKKTGGKKRNSIPDIDISTIS